jgi:4-hydroxybenzoate polyprenyltransferase
MRLDKPIGSLLLLWPTYWALFLSSDGWPDIDLLIIFTLGVVVMRTAGCVINDYADRNIDKHVKRTHKRPLTSGEISPRSALILFVILVLLAFILVLQTNLLTIQLSFIAAGLATIYPFTKRWTNLPQLVLGAAFGMSVPMAFAAQTGSLPLEAGLIFLASLVWTLIYDTLYAMADRDEDIKIGVKSTAILFKNYDQIVIAFLQLLLILILLIIGSSFNLGQIYYFSLIIIGFFMIYHQYLMKKRLNEQYFKAFIHNNYVGMTVFAGIFLSVAI